VSNILISTEPKINLTKIIIWRNVLNVVIITIPSERDALLTRRKSHQKQDTDTVLVLCNKYIIRQKIVIYNKAIPNVLCTQIDMTLKDYQTAPKISKQTPKINDELRHNNILVGVLL